MEHDAELIVAAVHDYFEGWFEADASRMRRALHPDLVKRSFQQGQGDRLSFVTAEEMTTWTGDGEGVRVAKSLTDRGIAVEVLDVKQDIASVLVRSEPYHEYLHMVRTGAGWKIANALWCEP